MKIIFKLFWFLLPMIGFSQTLLTNVHHRNKISLNGEWNYIVDPYQNGYLNFHGLVFDQQKNFQPAAYYNNYHAQNKGELVEYDFDKSPTMTIPGDWNSQKENLLYYEGSVWFKKSFDYELKKNKRCFVYFGAVNYKAEIYLNGIKLGSHEGGFTPFNFEVTEFLKPTDNYLIVKVDNTRKIDAVPTTNTDWWNYGGITRDVELIEESNAFVEDYFIQLKKSDKTVLSGFIKTNGIVGSNDTVSIQIPELKIDNSLKINRENTTNFQFQSKNIQYWSPENPKLYEVLITFNGQVLRDSIGFRTLETHDATILLNGEPVFLKGVSIHEENDNGGRAHSEADAQRLLSWAKEMGCNYVRLAHYPHNEHMLRLADQMGLMVWEEIPVYWTVDFTNPETYRNAENQLTEMITRDKNRAATIIWSMANETPYSEARNLFLKKLVEHTKSLDNTRMISAALLSHDRIIDDSIGEVLDIVAFNQYLGWYGGNIEDAEKMTWSTPYHKPVVVSEFGGGAKAGLHGLKSEIWTEEYQEYLYIQNLKMIGKIPHISGMSPWILVDFRSPRRQLPNIQDGWNRKGLISNNGIKKKAFYIMQKYYSNK